MAIGKYIVQKLTAFAGKEYGLGMEIVLDDIDAEDLIKTGNISILRYLDPADPADAADIAALQPASVSDQPGMAIPLEDAPLEPVAEDEENLEEESDDEDGPVDEENLG